MIREQASFLCETPALDFWCSPGSRKNVLLSMKALLGRKTDRMLPCCACTAVHLNHSSREHGTSNGPPANSFPQHMQTLALQCAEVPQRQLMLAIFADLAMTRARHLRQGATPCYDVWAQALTTNQPLLCRDAPMRRVIGLSD